MCKISRTKRFASPKYIEDDEIVLPTPLTTAGSDVSDEQTTEDRNVGENENRGEDSRYPL